MFTLDVKVSAILKEFIVSNWGSDTVALNKDDYFTQKIKHILQRLPETYAPIHPSERDEYIRLQVKQVAWSRRDTTSLFTKFPENAYLDDYLQQQIAKELNKYFKEIFHAYVLAFCSARRFVDNSQRDAIYDFCDVYNLKMNRVNFDMLKKSWNRSGQYQIFKKLRQNWHCIASL